VVNRAELLAMLGDVRSALPDSLSQAEALIGGREQMVEEARAEAQRIIESAHAERGSMISDTQIAQQSHEQAERILADARREAEEVRAEADDYVDSKLANFEVVLTKTIGSVDRGREKLLGHGPGLDEQGYEDGDAPRRSSDPETLRRDADAYVDAKLGAFEAVLAKTLEAVGRGRLKLTGHNAADELGAHMAAQDAVAGLAAPSEQTDAEFLAGLAAPAQEYQQQPQYDPNGGYGGYPQQDPYGQQQYQQDRYPEYEADPYAAQQPAQQLALPPAQQQPYQDPAYGYAQPPVPQQQPGYGYQPQQAALDETSFFDTGMIDLDRLRELEQGRGLG
jgi:vacuolar-type H+-ATPase subunit H